MGCQKRPGSWPAGYRMWQFPSSWTGDMCPLHFNKNVLLTNEWKETGKAVCGLNMVGLPHGTEGSVSGPPAVPGRGWRAGRLRLLAEQTPRPLSALSPLCTQGVRPGPAELHFRATKTTMPPSRNCQQHHRAPGFVSIFAEPEGPGRLYDIDLDAPLTSKRRVSGPAGSRLGPLGCARH